MKYLLVWCSLFWGLTLAAGAQTKTYELNQLYPVKELRQDLKFLHKALKEAHPSLYWYTPKDSLDYYFKTVYGQINQPMPERKFYRLVAPLLNQVRCGHTSLLPSKAYELSPQKPRPTYLPFEIWLDNDRLFVIKNNSADTSIQPGDEIISINGFAIKNIAAKARTLLPADGYNQTFKQFFMNWYFLEEVAWEYFGNREPFKLAVADSNGRVESKIVYRKKKPATANQASKQGEETRQSHRDALQTVRNIKILPEVPGAAVLTLNGFNYDDAPVFHKQVFREMAENNIRYLIIDLRQNPGGNLACSNDLLGYLRDTTFAQVTEMWATLRHPEKPSFYPHFNDQTRKFLLDNTTFARAANGKYYFSTDNVGPQKLQPDNHFRGKIFVLTGGFAFSAGSLMAASLKGLPNVTIIGQETGGGQTGCSGGIIQLLTLPHTGLRVKFPLFRIVSSSKIPNTGHGVYPDYPITYTLPDKPAGKDLELEKALHLIRNSSGSE